MPLEIATSEFKINAGYAGNLPASRAIQASGKTNLLDLPFMSSVTDAQGNLRSALPAYAEKKLVRYASDNKDSLVPGIRPLVTDEVFWAPGLWRQRGVFGAATCSAESGYRLGTKVNSPGIHWNYRHTLCGAEQHGYADPYDHSLFFGWQYVSEIDSSTAGKFFPVASKALYKKYLNP